MGERIMLVEDETIVAMDVAQRLEDLGYQVVAQATTGNEAVQLALDIIPDLILMDIKIRGLIDGIQTAAIIRETLDVPVIYLTAFTDDLTIKRASQTEPFGYLVKPFEDRELHSAIEVAVYKHKIEKKLRESEERYALAARAANDGIWDWDLSAGTVYYSPRWKQLLGLPENYPIHTADDWFERVHSDDRARLDLAIVQHLESITPSIECEYRIMHEDGRFRWMLCRGLALYNNHNRPYRVAGSQSDITLRKEIEAQLIHRALHDELTGLPNRALFFDRLGTILEHNRHGKGQQAAVLFLDIDHFKLINDSMGHSSGDALLKAFAERITSCIRFEDTLARFGGDEFAILMDQVQTVDEAKLIAERIQVGLQKPFQINGLDIYVSSSIGIALLTSRYQGVEELIRDVDAAMYHAKYNGRAHYEVFETYMHEGSMKRLQMEAEIRRAIQEKEFVIHYQPIYETHSLKLVGFEALLRWQHPIRGLLFPDEFLAIAEASGLLVPLGQWALHTACKEAQKWQQITGNHYQMAVNLSASQFNDRNLLQMIRTSLNDSGFNPHQLELELTESPALQNNEAARSLLAELHSMGILISIDDFGNGSASLEHIRYLPADNLKIDRSFLKNFQPEDTAIVTAIIRLAHTLNLQVIAEGVETNDQLSFLAKNDCDRVQGFLFGKSMPPETILSSVLSTSGSL